MKKLSNKIAIVTGGGKGIGQAISLRFASEGAKVAIWERDLDAATEVSQAITEQGSDSLAVNCDIGDAQSVANAHRITLESLGTPNLLVNNAGIAHVGNAINTKEEDFDQVMQINARGTFLCLKEVLPHMAKAGNGVILNLASIASRLGIADRFAYSASKGAVLAS